MQTVEFEECIGLTVEECEALIQQDVASNPELFENQASLSPQVVKVREAGDADYYYVALRTNLAGTGVIGVDGDGLVYYPYDWCIPTATGTPYCREIGPWDCDVGTPLTVDQCCTMIKASVPNADVNGNELTCFPDYPVGGSQNPTNGGRVIIAVNGQGIVVRPPRNE